MNHYDYIEQVSKQFSEALGLSGDIGSLAQTHADKCYQYQFAWEEADITFGKGSLVYLLSHLTPYNATVRRTPAGFVRPVDWVIEKATKDGPIKQALDQLKPRVHRVDLRDGYHEFHIYVDGGFKYKGLREHLTGGAYGNWILYKMLGDLKLEVDRDKYSNDLEDRVKHGGYDHLKAVPIGKKG